MLSVVPVKNALSVLLNANAWPTRSPVVRWGGPTENEDYANAKEVVYFGDVRDLEDTNQSFDVRVDETYDLRVHIDIVIEGDDEQATETRAWELCASVRAVLYANHNLITTPGTLVARLGDRTINQTNIAVPGAWIVRVTIEQTVNANVFTP